MSDVIRFKHSELETVDGVDRLRLDERDHYETGYAAGRLFAMSGCGLIGLLGGGFPRLLLSAVSRWLGERMRRVSIPPEYGEELRGLSDATRLPRDHLLLFNLLYELRGCSSFSFFQPDGSLVMGHNTDLLPFMARLLLKRSRPLVAEVSVPGFHRFVHMPVPLTFGSLSGFNDAGIALSSHYAIGTPFPAPRGELSTLGFSRMLLDRTASLDDARKLSEERRVCCPGIVLASSQRERRSAVLEQHPSRSHFLLLAPGRPAYITNHFRSDAMRPFVRTIRRGSADRLVCLEEFFERRDSLTVDEAIDALRDHRNGVQRGKTGYSLSNKGTAQSVLMDVSTGDVHIVAARKPPAPLNGPFVRVSTAVRPGPR